MKEYLTFKKRFLIIVLLLCNGITGMSLQDLYAQVTVTGMVTSAEDGTPLPGVNILEKGTTNGTVTNLDGEYSITVSSGDAVLMFSYVGYLSDEIAVQGQTNIDVILVEDIQALDEVVVIGYGTVKKDDLTGAVAVVTNEELNRTPQATIGNAIQGKAPGVLVTQSGRPGGGVTIRVRGIGSISRNPNPLYVIDGVVGAGINTIAPKDIESLQVLKDASSTAIYGADGANGVVIITTKRGTPGKTQVSFSAYGSVNTIPKQFDMMNANQYTDFYNEIYTQRGQTPPFAYTDEFRQFYYGDGWQEGTNWQDEIVQDAYTQNYYLSVSGGGENSNYSVSARYFNEAGLLYSNNAETFSLRANSDFDIGKYIRIGESLNISRRVFENAGSNAFNLALESSPLMKVYNEDNKEGFEGSQIPVEFPVTSDSTIMELNTGGNDKFNPLGIIAIPDNFDYRNSLVANVYLEVKPFDWLTFKTEPAITGSFNRDEDWTPRYEMGVRGTNAATLQHSFSEALGLSIQNQLTIDKSFNRHNFNIIAVHHGRQGWSNNSNVNALGFNYEQLNVITQGNETIAQGGYGEWARLSYLGRLLYDFDSKYLLTASIRRDGSSTFGEENRWGTFPSFSAAWKINEDLFPTFTLISMMKLRAGWGKTGNSSIGNFQFQTNLANPGEFHPVIGNQLVPALNEFRTIGNPLIKWEAADMTNIGVDMNAFDRKIQFTAEYFIKKQNDLLVKIPIPSTLGRQDGQPWVNLGEIQNQGFEFDLRYRKMEGVFNYTISANLSRVKNKVVNIPDPITEGNHTTENGRTIGSLYGYVGEGIIQESDFDEEGNYLHAIPSEGIPQPGDLKFKDLNMDGKITDDDRTIIGKPIPDFNYTFNIELFYKDFDFSLFLFGMQNYQVFNVQRSTIESFKSQDLDHNKSVDFADNYYREDRPTTEYLRADVNNTNNNTRISTWWVEDASFLRLQDVQLGYNLPGNTLSYLGITNARLFVSIKNLYTFTGYKGRDPEAPINVGNPLKNGIDNSAYPLPRVFTAGININF